MEHNPKPNNQIVKNSSYTKHKNTFSQSVQHPYRWIEALPGGLTGTPDSPAGGSPLSSLL
jgi:hypothetical protein